MYINSCTAASYVFRHNSIVFTIYLFLIQAVHKQSCAVCQLKCHFKCFCDVKFAKLMKHMLNSGISEICKRL